MTDADLGELEARWATSRLAVGDTVLALVAEVKRLRASLPPAGESVSDDDPRYRVAVEYRDGFGLATFRTPGCHGMSTGVYLLADTALGQMLAAEAWRGKCDRLRAENDRLRARVAELEGPQIAVLSAAAGGTSGPHRVR